MPTYTNDTVSPFRKCKLATLTLTETNVIELTICLVKAFTYLLKNDPAIFKLNLMKLVTVLGFTESI